MGVPRWLVSGVLLLTVALILTPPAAATSIVVNGSLEDPGGTFIDSGCNYMSLSSGSTAIPGWTVAPATTGAIVWAKTLTCDSQSASDATFFVDLSGYGSNSPNGAIQQQLTMTPNASYVLLLDVGTFNDGGIIVTIGNQPPLTFTPGVPFTVGSTSWTPKSATFTAVNATDTLKIRNATPGAMFVFLDHIVIAPACCDSAPACDGACPVGQECRSDGMPCHCETIVLPPCDQSDPSHCGGACNNGQTCALNPAGTACGCVDVPLSCAASSAPQCGGFCPEGRHCQQTAVGAPCECVASLPCSESQSSMCNGDCQAGQACVADPGGCHCQDMAVQCSDTAPQCNGVCPQGQGCVATPFPSSGCVCHDLPTCAASQAPMCNGSCPNGQDCVEDPTGCHCQDIVVFCNNNQFPQCNGVCPDGKRCEADLLYPGCTCHDIPTGCGEATAPACRADCPAGLVCRTNAAGNACSCLQPDPCTDHQAPMCNGTCSEGKVCTYGPVPGPCFCAPPPPTCGPVGCGQCDGSCPEGLHCTQTGPSGDCGCTPPPRCEDSEFPNCGGTCPKNHICSGFEECFCIEVLVACEQSDAPFCGGICPLGSTCGVTPSGACGCLHNPPPPCDQAGAPACNGFCPSGSNCTPFHNTCVCVGCVDTGGGPGDVGGVVWASKTRMQWDPEACASDYNVYRRTGLRLPDMNHDGVADGYGTCYAANNEVREITDSSHPPVDETNYYLVTGEGPNGEGTMGYASNGAQRPNTEPCP